MRKKIVAGNWKMNCDRDQAMLLTSEIVGISSDEKFGNTQIILAPSYLFLTSVVRMVTGTGIKVAAQNCSSHDKGAFTGEVSAEMIRSVGCDYVILGHSERRSLFNETDDLLRSKLKMVFDNELIPIFCIGEHLSDRESGKYFDVIQSQLDNGLFQLGEEQFSRVVIAYEPVWAIGTGKTAEPHQAQEVHHFIRQHIAGKYNKDIADGTTILYGGSCNESNAKELFALDDVDGGLIGGASLKSRSFMNIVKSV